MKIRRVVTGHTPEGKSVVASDMEMEGAKFATLPGTEILQIWGADRPPAFPDDGSPMPFRSYYPPAGGFRFGIFVAPPDTDPVKVDAVVAEMQAKFPGMAEAFDLDKPGMHTSGTIDLLYVMAGEIFLVLDDGTEAHLKAGDAVVQSGTRHAWRNRSQEDCLILYAMLGAHRSR